MSISNEKSSEGEGATIHAGTHGIDLTSRWNCRAMPVSSSCTPAVRPALSSKPDSELCKCFLTDMFVICADFRVETVDDTGVHFISQRVTDVKLYLKILLVSCVVLLEPYIQQALAIGLIVVEAIANPEDSSDEVEDGDAVTMMVIWMTRVLISWRVKRTPNLLLFAKV